MRGTNNSQAAKSNSTKPPKELLNILCFGDSLTAGYSMYGMKFTPYADTLKAFLLEQLDSVAAGGEVRIQEEGVSGELVTQSMGRRMEGILNKRKPSEPPFNWVVFLAGTNDLGWGRTPEAIWDAILAVSDIPIQRDGAKVLLCTIPECGVKSERLDGKRNEVNRRIREDGREGVYIFDLHAKIPYHSLDEAEQSRIWDDGLHLTEEGYERFGLMVGRRLLGILEHGEGREDTELEGTRRWEEGKDDEASV